MLKPQGKWNFHCYLNEAGEDKPTEFVNRLSKKARASLDRALDHL